MNEPKNIKTICYSLETALINFNFTILSFSFILLYFNLNILRTKFNNEFFKMFPFFRNMKFMNKKWQDRKLKEILDKIESDSDSSTR